MHAAWWQYVIAVLFVLVLWYALPINEPPRRRRR